jgi:phage antirepressor YoqD-like protein
MLRQRSRTDRLKMTGRCVVFPTQETHTLSHAVHAAFIYESSVALPKVTFLDRMVDRARAAVYELAAALGMSSPSVR